MEGCGKRIDLYHNEYAICGKNYGLKVYFCDACESARNLAQPDVKPLLCDVFVAFSAFRQGEGAADKYIQLSVDMDTEEEAKGVIETYKTTMAYSIKKPDYFIIMRGNKNFA